MYTRDAELALADVRYTDIQVPQYEEFFGISFEIGWDDKIDFRLLQDEIEDDILPAEVEDDIL